MKKIMTLCFFAFAMILGTQTVAAQTMVEINAQAATKTKELKKALKLTSDVEDKVYIAFQEYYQAQASLDKRKAEGEIITDDTVKKFTTMLMDKFKTLFNDEQMQRYLALSQTPN